MAWRSTRRFRTRRKILISTQVERAFCVSSPAHCPRVCRDAAVAFGARHPTCRWAVAPCRTDFSRASDVAVVEPPHRPDREQPLLHDVVNRVFRLPPADQAAMMGLYGQLEAELDASGFFHPPEKRPSMIQNLRSALGRAQFSDQEVRTFRGVVTALSRGRGRVLEKLARQKSDAPPPAET